MLNIEFDLTQGNTQINNLKGLIKSLAEDAASASEQLQKALNFKSGKGEGITKLAAEFSVLNSKLLPVKKNLDSVTASVKYLNENTVNLVSSLSKANQANKAAADANLKQAKAAAEAAAATSKSVGATREDIKAKAEAERIVRKYSTVQEKQAQDMERLADLVKKGVVSESAYATALENVANSQKKNSAETKKAADSTKELEQEVKVVSTEISRYIDLLKKQNAEFNKSAVQLMAMKKGWEELGDTEQKSALATLKLNEAHKLVAPALKGIDSPAQQLIKSLKALNLLTREGMISEEQAAEAKIRLRGQYDATRKAILDQNRALTAEQLSLEKAKASLLSYTATLEKSNQSFGKNSQELLKLRAGWGSLTETQQKSLQSAAAVNSSFETLGSYVSRLQTPLSKYHEAMAAIEVAKRRYIETNGEEGISLANLRQITKLIADDYYKEVAALNSATATVSKYDSAVAKSKTDLLSHLSALRQSNTEFGKSKLQIMQASLGWDKLSTSQQRALTSQQKYADTMGRVHSILGRVKNDADIAAKAIKDLDRALAIGNKTGGRRGITPEQHTAGVGIINKELEANRVKALGAAHATKIFTTNTGLANQATAGFRAALMGANLGFGMFTSSTVLTAAAMFGLAKALTFTVTAGAAFEVAFERAAVVMGEFGSVADGTLGTLSNKALMVQDLILDLAENTQYGTVEVAKAASVLAQAGLEPIEVFNALAPSLHLAAIGMVDVAEAADIAVGVMYGFGKTSQDLSHIVDVMAKTTVITNLSLKQVAKTMEYIAPVAKQMGLTVEDAAAAVGILGNASIKGSKAGTSLRAILVRATTETPKAAQAFKDLGISISDFTQDGVLNLQRLFSLLDKKGASVSQMKDIMGQWAITAAFALTDIADKADKSGRSWESYAKKLKDVEGVAAEMAAGLRKNLTGAVEDLTSVIETIATRAFGNYGQELEDQVRRLTNFIKENQTEIVATLTSVMKSLLWIFTTIVEWSGTISELLQMFIAFKVVRGVIAGVVGVIGLVAAAAERAALSSVKLSVALGQVALGQVAVGRASAASAILTGDAIAAAGVKVAATATLAGRALAFMTGPFGILLTAASFALPSIIEWLTNTSPEIVYEHADAMEKYARALELTEQGPRQIDMMGADSIRMLRNELRASTDEQIANLQRVQAEHVKLLNIKKDLASNPLGLPDNVIKPLEAENNKAIAKSYEERMLAVRKYLAVNSTLASSEGDLKSATDAHTLSQKILNDAKDKGLKGSERIAFVTNTYASEMNTAAKAAESYARMLNMLYGAFESLSLLMPTASVAGTGVLENARNFANALAQGLRARTPTAEPVDNHAAAAAAAEAEAAIKAQVSALESQIKAYEKSTVSITEYNQKLREVTETEKFLSSGSKEATEKLKELGYSASEAMDAMKVNKEDIIKEYLIASLTKADAKYKDLANTMELLKPKTQGAADSTKVLQEAVASLPPEFQALGKAMSEYLANGVKATDNGNSQLLDNLKRIREESALFWAEMSNPTSTQGILDLYAGIATEQDKLAISTLQFKKIFGSSLSEMFTEDEKIANAESALAGVRAELERQGVPLTKINRLWKDYEATLPTGALLKENENLKNQTTLLLSGVDSLELYNAAWEATNGHLEDVTDAFVNAKLEQIAFQKQLEQIQAVRQVYEQFGDGLSKIFTDLFTGGIKSFRDFADRLKSLFKQMIADLLAMAIKNSIFEAMFGTTGNTAGFFQAIAGVAGNNGASNSSNPLQMLTSMFGSGSPINGTGANNNLISRFFGGGGGGATGTTGSWLSRLFGGGGTATATGSGNVGGLTGLGGNIGNWSPAGTASGSGFSLGAALPYAGAALGGFYGFSNRGTSNGSAGSLAAGAAYGIGGLALGTVAMYGAAGAAGAAGMGAGAMAAGASGGAAMGAAAVPVIGWIIAAIAAIDMITGGKVFGTRYKPESSTSTTRIGEEGGTASATVREVRQRSLFRGRQWRNRAIDVDPEAQDAAEELFEAIQEVLASSARQLGIDAPPMIDAAIRSVTEYDSKGKAKATKIFVDILGRTWEEATSELAATRITGEAIIYAVDTALDHIFETVASDAADSAQVMGEASTIAERWRDDAETLLDGAQFLLMAATDMRNGIGLFKDNAPGVLTRTADIIEELAFANETLQEAYARVRESVFLTERTLGGFGIEAGRTREEFITFSSALVESLGGIEAATQKLEAFSEAFGSIADMGDYRTTQATTNRQTLMTGIGLDPGTSAAEFIAAFTAGIAEMAPDVAARWINAGMALVPIHNALEALRQQAEATDDPLQEVRDNVAESIESLRQMGATPAELAQAWVYGNEIIQRVIDDLREQLSDFMLGIEEQIADLEGSEYENQLTSISRAMRDNMEQARNMGASLADLARIEALAAAQIRRVNEERARQLSDMMNGIEGQLSQFEGRTFIYAMQNIRREMEENIRTATALGASTAQLARIQQLAAAQIAQAMQDLRDSITGLVENLYGRQAQEQVAGFSQASSNASAQEQAESETTNQLELRRYDAAQDAIKRIDEYLRGLRTGDQSPGGWRERLQAARTNYEEIYARAMQGDPEAMAQLASAAQQYLEMAQEAYGPGVTYSNIFGEVETMLRAFQAYAATIVRPPDPVEDQGGGGGGGGSSGGSTDVGLTAQERYRLALQLAQNIGELGIALDVSVFDLMREFGIDIDDLAADLGIDLSHLSIDMVDNLRTMASALGVPIGELITELGITSQQLGEMFGVSLTSFSESNLAALAAMAESLGISIFESMAILGMDLDELASSFGIDIAHLNSGMGASLVSLAGLLGVSLSELSEALGLTLAELATAFGVSATSISSSTLQGLQAMAEALGLSVGELVTQLGISLTDLAASVGIDIDAMNAGTVAQLSALAGTLGMSVMALVSALGIDLAALATAFGIDLDNMNEAAYTRFVAFAEELGLNIFQLAEGLGMTVETFTAAFVGAMNAGLDNIPDLPADIEEELRPLLTNIATATTSAGAAAAISSLGSYINSLPAGIGLSLSSLFTSLGGIITTAATTAPLSTTEYQSESLRLTAATVAASEGVMEAVGNASRDIVDTIATSSNNIVNAINGPASPPAPALMSSLMAYWAIEDSQSGGASDYYSEQSAESAKRVEEAIAMSAKSAENMQNVEEKLEEVVSVFEEKLESLKKTQEDANEKLQKISKSTNQLNEKQK